MMDYFYMTKTGTRTSGVPSTTVSANEDAVWADDAQCYPSFNRLSTVFNNISAGATIVYDDTDIRGAHSVNTGSMLSATGDILIHSRSGVASNCEIHPADENQLWANLNGTGVATFTINDIKLSSDAIITRFDRLFLQISGANISSVVMNRCITGDMVLGNTSENLRGMFYQTGTTNVFTLNDHTISNITGNKVGGALYGHIDSGTLRITGTFTIQDVSPVTYSGGNRGGFWGNSKLDIPESTIINITNFTQTVSIAGNINRALFSQASNDITSLGQITCDNVNLYGGTAGATIFDLTSAVTPITVQIANVVNKNGTVTWGSGDNSRGGTILLTGVGITAEVRNIKAENVNCRNASAVYFSDGAHGTIKGIQDIDCTTEAQAAIYIGGYRDVDVDGFAIIRHTSLLLAGPALHAYNHDTTCDANRIVNFRNGVIKDCVNPSIASDVRAEDTCNGSFFYNHNTTYTLTINIENVISHNGGINEFVGDESATSAGLTINVDNCDIDNYSTSINNITRLNTGNATMNVGVTTPVTDTPDQLTPSGKLVADSALRTRGTTFGFGRVDARLRRMPIPPPVGGYAPSGGDPSNTRTVRT